MGANYEDVLKRLYNEGMICRFTLMFLNDDSYPKLEQALKEGNVKEAFRAAHTLKGVCQNLGFTNLYQPTYDLTEVLRTGTLEGTKELFDSVAFQYKITIKGGVRSSKLRIWLDLQNGILPYKKAGCRFLLHSAQFYDIMPDELNRKTAGAFCRCTARRKG